MGASNYIVAFRKFLNSWKALATLLFIGFLLFVWIRHQDGNTIQVSILSALITFAAIPINIGTVLGIFLVFYGFLRWLSVDVLKSNELNPANLEEEEDPGIGDLLALLGFICLTVYYSLDNLTFSGGPLNILKSSSEGFVFVNLAHSLNAFAVLLVIRWFTWPKDMIVLGTAVSFPCILTGLASNWAIARFNLPIFR